ncbi:ABC-three component system protein [Achromobacter xylosoxidans]|uniref:ABC-three component system protein n=1 Tax=Alcaligenes xylosoxydans xylosoxydans TaxID=85698 RepID=UPI0034D77A10
MWDAPLLIVVPATKNKYKDFDMAGTPTDKFSAGEQGLGYIYQARLALLQLLQLPEDTAIFLEKDDDLDFIDSGGGKSLASLKHKAVGDRLTDLSTDFWKSVNIWLVRYKRDGRATSNLRFFLFTTGAVSTDSFLGRLLPDQPIASSEANTLTELANLALARSTSKLISPIATAFNELSDSEKQDFLERILILDGSPRIGDIPTLIKDKHMRSVRREHRDFVFERLEGWWTNAVINQLTGGKSEGIFGYEVSDKLSNFAEEYKADNLPITFRGKVPTDEIDTDADPRLFVAQLREIGISSNRIRSAILDYYRAFEQRSAWARENLLVLGEVEEYEDRLTDEWDRYKDVAFEKLKDDSAEEALREAGATLYYWAEFETGKIESLRIRARVTEPYVLRGSFHILADSTPEPKVYWHPRFLDRLGAVLGVAS